MRLKYYLRGAGFGIIVATLIFIIAIQSKGGLFTEEKAISFAKEAGYTISEEKSNPLVDKTASADAVAKQDEKDTTVKEETPAKEDTTVKENTTVKEDATVKEDTTVKEETPSKEETTVKEETPAKEETTVKEETPAKEETTVKEETPAKEATSENNDTTPKSLVVNSNDGSETVSARLAEAGLVKNADDFNKYLITNGYDRKIRTGTFQINSGSSYEEIAKAITSRS